MKNVGISTINLLVIRLFEEKVSIKYVYEEEHNYVWWKRFLGAINVKEGFREKGTSKYLNIESENSKLQYKIEGNKIIAKPHIAMILKGNYKYEAFYNTYDEAKKEFDLLLSFGGLRSFDNINEDI